MRRPNAKITVTAVMDHSFGELRPVSFVYLRQTFRIVQVCDQWNEVGRWWENEPEAVLWRVADQRGGLYELMMVRGEPPEWRVMVIYD